MSELRATYRLQLGPAMTFEHVRDLVPYLKELGVSHVYLSPSFQAQEGSTHGYDVIDPTRISEALGGEESLRALAADVGVILDIVPNHMAGVDANRYWADPELRRKYFDLDPVSGRWRRFFDIDELAGVRQEDLEVFEETHKLPLRLVAEGVVDGLRVDHPDGLADPAGYLARLRERGVERVWVEKILEAEEELRDWPVSGTVGYEFLNDVAALFVDPAGEATLTELYRDLTGERRPFHEVADEAKLQQASTTFQPEVDRLRRIVEAPELERALASLPIYRTYVRPVEPDDADRTSGADPDAAAAADRPFDDPDPAAADLLGSVAPADRAAIDAARERGMPAETAECLTLERDAPSEFVTRFQQTTPAITAKGVEDTAFYRDVRLLALNEVGGDPGRFSLSVEDFHARCAERARRFPQNLLITQTHDTKRSGDSRARIGALAGIAAEWRKEVERWFELASPLRTEVGGRTAPDPTEEYLIYQTLVGVWPASAERVEEYVRKALREAKRNTNWVEPDEEWEGAVLEFVRRLYGPGELHDAIASFATRQMPRGERASVGQLLLKLTTPGVPDVYQGDELWALSMVDPDNRRPVDWEMRRDAIAALDSGAPVDRANVKMHLIRRALALRARRPEPFAGAYRPLAAADPLCAFTRGDDEVLAVAAVRDAAAGATFRLPEGTEGEWRDVLAGSGPDGGRTLTLGPEVPFDQVRLPGWPVALLERARPPVRTTAAPMLGS